MNHSTGADVKTALAALALAGYTVRQLADDLGLARSTVYRWRSGRYFPNAANFEALVEWTESRYGVETHRRTLTTKALHLRQAFEALETDEQRAANDALAEEIRQHLADGEVRRRGEAEHQLVPQQRRSAFADTDPFVLAGAKPEPALF